MSIRTAEYSRTKAVQLQIIRASEFIQLDVREHLNFEETRKTLQGLVLACRKRGLDRAMLDLRSLPVLPSPHFTPSELGALVSTFRHAGFSHHHRLAILYDTDLHHGIRTFAFVNRMRGLQVQAFTDFEAAFTWLSEEPQHLLNGDEVEGRITAAKRKREHIRVVFAPQNSTHRPLKV